MVYSEMNTVVTVIWHTIMHIHALLFMDCMVILALELWDESDIKIWPRMVSFMDTWNKLVTYFGGLLWRNVSEIYLFIYCHIYSAFPIVSMLKYAAKVIRWREKRAHRPVICMRNWCTHYVHSMRKPLPSRKPILNWSLSHTYAHSAILVYM